MGLGPKIRGRKTKSIRVDVSDLKSLREELKATKEWKHYAEAADSELIRLGVMFARLHMQPDVYVMTLESVNQLVDEAVKLNIGQVALALGGVAQMNPDKTITVMRPGADAPDTLKAKAVGLRRPPRIN